jgi:hypothetical protein
MSITVSLAGERAWSQSQSAKDGQSEARIFRLSPSAFLVQYAHPAHGWADGPTRGARVSTDTKEDSL